MVLILMKFSLVENININWIKNIIVVFLRLQNGQKFLVWLVEEYIRTTMLRKPIQHHLLKPDTLGIYPAKMSAHVHQEEHTRLFLAALFAIAPKLKAHTDGQQLLLLPFSR